MNPDPRLADRLARHGQDHLLRWWDELDEPQRSTLAEQIEQIDLERLSDLVTRLVQDEEESSPDPSRVDSVEVARLPQTDAGRVARRRAIEVGESALASGEVAALLVAGGQGTRLGFDGPKGTYAIGPVSGASLFQIHAEKLLARSRRHGRLIPLYVMTSPENHEETIQFFDDHDRFGLDHVRFFTQGQMPAVDRQSGKILLADKDRIALSPDGHGGTLAALAAPGAFGEPSCLEEMRELGIRTLFYFQVDNPLVQVCDPAYIGLHRRADAELSFKIVEKRSPEEKVGVVVNIDGQPRVIEYSNLAPELAERREPDGSLQLWAGSIAIHLFEREFIERLVSRGGQLPFHRALKKVRHINSEGLTIEPDEPNAVKFETFIFDALPMARKWAIVETERSTEFEPLKNAIGADSPASVRQRMSDLFACWLESAGARVLRRSDGTVPFGIEISPLYALDAQELKAKLPSPPTIDRPIFLGPGVVSGATRP
ncbi:UDPGP type 1 family protein [soil metagenome]